MTTATTILIAATFAIIAAFAVLLVREASEEG
jgi:hypothetical protein